MLLFFICFILIGKNRMSLGEITRIRLNIVIYSLLLLYNLSNYLDSTGLFWNFHCGVKEVCRWYREIDPLLVSIGMAFT